MNANTHPSASVGALRLPAPLHDAAQGSDWSRAAQSLAARWIADAAAPSAGELAAATALQGALSARLGGIAPQLDGPAQADQVSAALALNPDLGWYAELISERSCPAELLGPWTQPGLRLQLAWVVEHWSQWLDGALVEALALAGDLLAEEQTHRGGGPGPIEAPDLGALVGEPGYSVDAEWMAEAVFTVRHARVWLSQLSRWFDRPVTRLDEIPDAALAELVADGASCLWLVGIWERSVASRTIKQRRGNPDAAASAYSLVDYVVSAELGGEGALDALVVRARARGLSLCADVVPNHTGLDSRWVVEHPEWFIQAPEPPFPGYRFTGPDISGDPRVQVRIEDGYWDGSDAAVVYECTDVESGQTRWLYHGNDGTSMPWNDTAQLDLTLAPVRQALIDAVVGLAQRFRALRFDAAMALAERHVRRLWYPDAGSAGAIPSRAGKGLSPEQWATRMPQEFWVELAHAVAVRAPGTLLLAEAFWMMEVDFARTFGINRVYWSAFRDWLREGKHSEHQAWLRAAVAQEPRLLERLCLFLSNPDEESCAAAFGTGERYLAAATLQCAMPGLPLLAHGQAGGLTEQYGMEFVRPRLDEAPDADVVARHRELLAPLLGRRDLLGRAEHFRLFPVDGHDAVYAFTNRRGDQRALIVVNASPEERWGTVRHASPGPEGGTPTLCEALGLAEGGLVRFFDARAGLHYLRRPEALVGEGLVVGLKPWQCQVFLEIEALADSDGLWAELELDLGGRGVPDLDVALAENARDPLRRAGVLLHPSSLPGSEPIGTLGEAAIQWLDWLQAAGFRAWQVLPLNPVGPGESPYSSPASRLGNPLLVDLRRLVEQGWLRASEITGGPPAAGPVDYAAARAWKVPLLTRAAGRLLAATEHPDHRAWVVWRSARPWVDDDVLFAVLKADQGGLPWWEWPEALRGDRAPLRSQHADAVAAGSVVAFWFDQQWATVRDAAQARDIQVIGDLPIYVALDSADVWTAPEQFQLGTDGLPVQVSGVPPDAFSDDGQLWGNPLYAWETHAEQGYAWWIERVRRAREWTPTLRIDHFRAFAAYYAIPSTAETARDGRWVEGPGLALFDAVNAALGEAAAVAEDLGEIDDAVHALRESTGLMATRVLQFGVGDSDDNLHQPTQIPEDAAVYTGTHDNDTTQGWFGGVGPEWQRSVAEQLSVEAEAPAVCAAMIDAALGCTARLAIIPVQDLLGLGSEARMNTPGTPSGNWAWRMEALPELRGWRARIRQVKR